MSTDSDLVRALIDRAVHDIEHGWYAAALDALGRALRLTTNNQADTPHVTR
jgi:hypothetical protein